MTVDRSNSPVHSLSVSTPGVADFDVFDGEDLVVHIFFDAYLVKAYMNDRLTLTLRSHPSLETLVCAFYNFDSYPESGVDLQLWDKLSHAWPERVPGNVFARMDAHIGNDLRQLELARSQSILGPAIVA
jgi:hypothetical protein